MDVEKMQKRKLSYGNFEYCIRCFQERKRLRANFNENLEMNSFPYLFIVLIWTNKKNFSQHKGNIHWIWCFILTAGNTALHTQFFNYYGEQQ